MISPLVSPVPWSLRHMLSSVEIKPDVYFVGALDWTLASSIPLKEGGITYNAYLILDEKDTVSLPVSPRSWSSASLSTHRSSKDWRSDLQTTLRWTTWQRSSHSIRAKRRGPQVHLRVGELQGFLWREYQRQRRKDGRYAQHCKRTLTFVQTPMVHWLWHGHGIWPDPLSSETTHLSALLPTTKL